MPQRYNTIAKVATARTVLKDNIFEYSSMLMVF